MSKLTNEDISLIKKLVATMSLKRIPDNEIISGIENKLNKFLTRQTLYNIRHSIKNDSFE
jgi:hypothetical protein